MLVAPEASRGGPAGLVRSGEQGGEAPRAASSSVGSTDHGSVIVPGPASGRGPLPTQMAEGRPAPAAVDGRPGPRPGGRCRKRKPGWVGASTPSARPASISSVPAATPDRCAGSCTTSWRSCAGGCSASSARGPGISLPSLPRWASSIWASMRCRTTTRCILPGGCRSSHAAGVPGVHGRRRRGLLTCRPRCDYWVRRQSIWLSRHYLELCMRRVMAIASRLPIREPPRRAG